MPLDRLFEGLARGAQARVRRVQRNLEDLSDFRHGELVELDHHEYLALRLIELRQDMPEKANLIALIGKIERRRCSACLRLGRERCSGGFLRPLSAMVSANGAPNDSVDPASQRFGLFESVDARVDHDEYFLDDVVYGRISDA